VRRLARARAIPIADWGATVKLLPDAAPRAVDEVREQLVQVWPLLAASDEFRQPTREGGVELWDLAASRLRYWLTDLVPRQWGIHTTVRETFAARPPAAVLVPHVMDSEGRAAFMAFRSVGVPTWIYQHGGFVGSCECPPWDVNDLWMAERILTYGDGVSAYFAGRRHRRSRPLAAPVSVGSSRLDSVRRPRAARRANRSRPLVLIVPGVIAGNNRSFDKGTLPDLVEVELQAALVAATRAFPQCEFVFKAFPWEIDAQTPAARLAAQPGANCRLDLGSKLPRLMERASLIVMTVPSTALLEALQTDARILVLVDDRSIEMTPQADAALARRAFVEHTVEGFLATYRRLLTAGDFAPVMHADRTFVCQYGTHQDDGHSAERALEALGAAP